MTPMPDPFLLIVAVIAVLCVVLFPLRIWRKRHRRYGNEGGEVADAPHRDAPD